MSILMCLHQYAAAGPAGPGGRSQAAFSGCGEAQRREQRFERGAAETQKGLLFVFFVKAPLGT